MPKSNKDFYWKYFERPRRILSSLWNKLLKRDNWYLINKEVNKCKNEIVLDLGRVVKLLGVKDEPDDDYYYEYQDINGRIYYSSCVMGFTRLKNKLGYFEYYNLAETMEYNIKWKTREDLFHAARGINNA